MVLYKEFLGDSPYVAQGYFSLASQILAAMKRNRISYHSKVSQADRRLLKHGDFVVEIYVSSNVSTGHDKIRIIAKGGATAADKIFGVYVYINGNPYPVQLSAIPAYGDNLTSPANNPIINGNITVEDDTYSPWMGGLTYPLIQASTGFKEKLTGIAVDFTSAEISGLNVSNSLTQVDYSTEDLRVADLILAKIQNTTDGVITYSNTESRDNFYNQTILYDINGSFQLFPVDGSEITEYDETGHPLPPTFDSAIPTFRFNIHPVITRVRLNNAFMTSGWGKQWVGATQINADQPFSTNTKLLFGANKDKELIEIVNGKKVEIGFNGESNTPENAKIGQYYPQQGLIDKPLYPEFTDPTYRKFEAEYFFYVGKFGGLSADGDNDLEQNSTDTEKRIFYSMQPYYYKLSGQDANKIYMTGAQGIAEGWIEESRFNLDSKFADLSVAYSNMASKQNDWNTAIETYPTEIEPYYTEIEPYHTEIETFISTIQTTTIELATIPSGETVSLPNYSQVREGQSSDRVQPAISDANGLLTSISNLSTVLRNKIETESRSENNKTTKGNIINLMRDEINTLPAFASAAINFQKAAYRLDDDVTDMTLHWISLGKTAASLTNIAKPSFFASSDTVAHTEKYEEVLKVPASFPNGTIDTGNKRDNAYVDEFNIQSFYVTPTFNGVAPTIKDELIAVKYARPATPWHSELFPELSKFIILDNTDAAAGPFNSKGAAKGDVTVSVKTWTDRGGMGVYHILNYYDGVDIIQEIDVSPMSYERDIERVTEYTFHLYSVDVEAKTIYSVNGSTYQNPTGNKSYWTNDVATSLYEEERPRFIIFQGSVTVDWDGGAEFGVRTDIGGGQHLEYKKPPSVNVTHKLSNFRWIHSATLQAGVNDRIQFSGGSLTFGFTDHRYMVCDVDVVGLGNPPPAAIGVNILDMQGTEGGLFDWDVTDTYAMENTQDTEF